MTSWFAEDYDYGYDLDYQMRRRRWWRWQGHLQQRQVPVLFLTRGQ